MRARSLHLRASLVALAVAGLVASGAALAQAAPPPPAAGPAAAPPPPDAGPGDVAMIPPPPPSPGRGAPPPPPPGPHVVVDRGADGLVHVDVKCAERESTEACAGIATQMLDKLGADAKSR